MTQTLLIALALTLPLAGLAWLAAAACDRLGASVHTRLAAWTLALILPALAPPAALAIQAAGVQSPIALANLALPIEQPAYAIETVAYHEAAAALPEAASNWVPTPDEDVGEPWPITALLLAILAGGAAFRLMTLMLGLRRLSHLTAASTPIDAEDRDRLGLTAADQAKVRLGDHDTPILAGVLRPVILIPRRLVTSLTPAQAALVCAHERAHLAVGDHLSHLMEEVIVRLFWFNPLLTAVRERLDAVREEACDARTLGPAPEAHRRAYAEALLAAMRLSSGAAPAAAFTGLRKHGAARRFQAILRPAKPRAALGLVWTALAAIGLVTATGGAALALAAQPLPSAPPAPTLKETVTSEPAEAEVDQPRRYRIQRVAPPPAPPKPGAPVPPPAPGDFVFWRDDGAEAIRRPLSEEQRHALEQAQADADQAMRLSEKDRAVAEKAMRRAQIQLAEAFPKNKPDAEGRVLMRCKLAADGKAQDCQTIDRGMFIPAPPLPPLPPEIPAPPAPPHD